VLVHPAEVNLCEEIARFRTPGGAAGFVDIVARLLGGAARSDAAVAAAVKAEIAARERA